jgi:hypothetical protein
MCASRDDNEASGFSSRFTGGGTPTYGLSLRFHADDNLLNLALRFFPELVHFGEIGVGYCAV